MNENINIESQFQFSGELTRRKLREYLPAILFTNLSTLLLVSVDGLVVGNFLGKDALSSVSIFTPATLFIGVLTVLLCSGAASQLSVGMGQIDLPSLLKSRSTIKFLLILFVIFISIIQVPLIAIFIQSYHLSPEMNSRVWSYAIGVMISMPFGLVSSLGSHQLQIVGKMKLLVVLGIIEGVTNLLLDLLFVGPLKMDVAGAGYGTAIANIVRASLTLFFLIKKTDMFYSGKEKPSWKEGKAILLRGLPDAAQHFMTALRNYFMMAIILSVFGEIGGAINGVCSFGSSIAMVLIRGVQGAVRPLTGLMIGADDVKGTKLLLRQGFLLIGVLTGALILVVEIFPGILFVLNGVKPVPEGGLASLRLYYLSFILMGCNTLFRLYFANRKIIRFSTILTVAGNAALPLFAFLLSKILPPPWIWLSYLICEGIMTIANTVYYFRLQKRDCMQENPDMLVLYLTIAPEEAVEASRQIRSYALEHGINERYAYRAALCIEEMLAYAESSHNDKNISVQVMIRFLSNSARVMILDDGQCIFFDKEEEQTEIVTSNYGLLKRIAKKVEYQYILNMNYTICQF